MTDILLVALWGAVVLVSMDGWGRVAARLAPSIPSDVGLRLAWGAAVLLALGGITTALSIATAPVVTATVVAGALLALPGLRKPGKAWWITPAACAVWLVLVVHYLQQVATVPVVCADDHVAYWGFIKRQLALGDVNEPFSLRRLAGHGGQMFLQSLVVAQGGLDNAFLIERGIAPIVTYLLLRGLLPGRRPVSLAVALSLTLIALAYEFNSQSVCTGVVLFLGLARTLNALDTPERARTGEMVLLGLLVAGAASLRAHFLVGAGMTTGLWLIVGWRERPAPGQVVWRVALMAGAALAFFAPWMFGLWRSSGTPLFPLLPGTGAGGYNTFSFNGQPFYYLALRYLTASDGLFLFLPIMGLWRAAPERKILVITWFVALAVMLLFSWRFPTADVYSFARYLWPMVLVPVCLSLIGAVRGVVPRPTGSLGIVVLLAAAVVISAVRVGFDVRQFAIQIDSAEPEHEARLAALYRRMQDLVPPGETLLVATDNPYLIDYSRNRTVNLDLPGAASPAPGMPFFRGAEAMRRYLLAKGVHYLLFADGWQREPCVFDRGRYTSPTLRQEDPLVQLQARYILDFLDNMASLSAGEATLARRGHYTLLNLRNGPGDGSNPIASSIPSVTVRD